MLNCSVGQSGKILCSLHCIQLVVLSRCVRIYQARWKENCVKATEALQEKLHKYSREGLVLAQFKHRKQQPNGPVDEYMEKMFERNTGRG